MNDELNDSTLGRALGAYSRSLRQVRPSSALDARLAASIREHAGLRPVRPAWRRPLPWVAAAASVATIAAGVALLVMRAAPPESAQGIAQPAGALSDQSITQPAGALSAQSIAQPAGAQSDQSIAQPAGTLSAQSIDKSGAPSDETIGASAASRSASNGAVPALNDTSDRLVIPSGQYSLWPTEAAVFRVKASLGGGTQSVPGERQYWVDVRVANDGSMRIVRVLPANPEE